MEYRILVLRECSSFCKTRNALSRCVTWSYSLSIFRICYFSWFSIASFVECHFITCLESSFWTKENLVLSVHFYILHQNKLVESFKAFSHAAESSSSVRKQWQGPWGCSFDSISNELILLQWHIFVYLSQNESRSTGFRFTASICWHGIRWVLANRQVHDSYKHPSLLCKLTMQLLFICGVSTQAIEIPSSTSIKSWNGHESQHFHAFVEEVEEVIDFNFTLSVSDNFFSPKT